MPAIFPNYTAPVVRYAADGEREIMLMNWGFPLLQPGKAPRRVTNVRDDKILTSAFWRPSFEERRCLVPGGRFHIAVRLTERRCRHWFALKGDNPQPLFAFRRHLAALHGPDQEGRAQRRLGRLLVPDHDTEPAGSDREDKSLRKLYPTMTRVEIAHRLGRTPFSIMSRVKWLGLRKRPTPDRPWRHYAANTP